MEHLTDESCDICLIQETFLREEEKAKLQEIQDYGWNIISNPRKHRSGGGVAILYRKHLKIQTNLKVTKPKSFQVMEVTICTKTGMMRLVNVYRPGYSQKARHTACFFLEEFGEYLDELAMKPGEPIIAGDFNFHVERPEELYPKKFQMLLEEYDLLQCTPLIPTHEDGGTLDLVLSSEAVQLKMGPRRVLVDGTKSDHYLVHFDLNVEPTATDGDGPQSITYRNFNEIDLEVFRRDISLSPIGNESSWSGSSLDEVVESYNSSLKQLMDKHAPLNTKKIKKERLPLDG